MEVGVGRVKLSRDDSYTVLKELSIGLTPTKTAR